MKKYHIKHLCIELTRRCNYKCAHCFHGDAQDLTITPEIIDTAFSQMGKVEHISLFGGESLLALDMLEYLLDAIDNYNLETAQFDFITNGSIQNQHVLKLLSNFVNRADGRLAAIGISSDPFHDRMQSKIAFSYYKNRNKNNNITIRLQDKINYLSYEGYAKACIVDNRESLLESGISFKVEDSGIRKRQICIKNDTIECRIEIAANGNVGVNGQISYDKVDRLSIGNIMDCSFETMIKNHNATCIAVCDELYAVAAYESLTGIYKIKTDIQTEINCAIYKIKQRTIELIWEYREKILQKFPAIPAQEIIMKTPTLSHDEIMKVIDYAETSCYEDDKDEIERRFEELRKEYPFAPKETLKHLNLCRYGERLVTDIFNVNVLMIHLCRMRGHGTPDLLEKWFANLEKQYLSGKRTAPKGFNPCALIPDTLDTPRDEDN